MSWLDKLEKRFYRFSIPNLTIILIIGQILFFGLTYSGTVPIEDISLVGREVLAGQYWRLFSFLLIPITNSVIFAIFVWYLYYLYGSALEGEWGTFKYNVYIFLSYVFTVLIAFIFPDFPLTNTYIYGSIFLAFAYLYPDFQINIFFFFPIKVKWLALIQWITYAILLVFGTWDMRVLLLASIANFLLFFGKDLILRIRYRVRKQSYTRKKTHTAEKPFLTCSICGVTDKQNPNMEFRYCVDCDHKCFCMDHLDGHDCVKNEGEGNITNPD